MIEVERLTKTYGSARGITDISFSVGKGEILGFLGPNGAGKTTTMRILTCFMSATSGSARIAGFDVFEDALAARRQIGYLPETVPLYTDMQVPVYLRFVAGLKGVPYRQIKIRVEEVMERVGLTHMAHKYIGELSKGYRQRVGLAQALVNDPQVLILDEPTIGLDPKQIIEIRSLIKGLQGERTIILSSHILPEISMIAGRVIIIDEGRIKAMDTPDNLMRRLRGAGKTMVRLTGPREKVIRSIQQIDGVARVEAASGAGDGEAGLYLVEFANGQNSAHKIARAAAENHWDLHELTPVKMSLEDIFIRIVTEEEAAA